MTKISDKAYKDALQLAIKKYGNRPDVTAVDLGYKWSETPPKNKTAKSTKDKTEPVKEMEITNEEQTKIKSIRIHVQEKLDESALEAAEIFPEKIGDVPVDVIEAEYEIKRETHPREHREPQPILLSGISIGRPDEGTGTLGTFVIDKQTNRPAILSNWHVLVGPNGHLGDEIIQPGGADNGKTLRDKVATLGRSLLDQKGDAAIAPLDNVRPWLPFIYGSFTHLDDVRDSILDEVLTKSGRTTGQTKGRVDGEGVYFIRYEIRPGVQKRIGVYGFKLVDEKPNNPTNNEISSGGDSGSVWYHEGSKQAVGLHFAGETNPLPNQEHAIACNLKTVMEALDIRLATAEDLLNASRENYDQESLASSLITKQSKIIETNPVSLEKVAKATGASVRNKVIKTVCGVLRRESQSCATQKKPKQQPYKYSKDRWLQHGREMVTTLQKTYIFRVDDGEIKDFFDDPISAYMGFLIGRIQE